MALLGKGKRPRSITRRSAGVPAASVVILGGGVAGTNAAQIASGMGADVAIPDRNPEALRRIASQLGNRAFESPQC
jgi:alanine dehydrogenase